MKQEKSFLDIITGILILAIGGFLLFGLLNLMILAAICALIGIICFIICVAAWIFNYI